MWYNLSYLYGSGLKNHIVHESLLKEIKEYLESQYSAIPDAEDICESIYLDPGGMISTRNVPVEFGIIKVRPEHICNIISCWNLAVKFDNYFKVYLPMEIIVLPHKEYYEIGSWLAQNKALGIISKEEIIQALNGNIIIKNQKTKENWN